MGIISSIIDAGASIYSANKSAKSAKNINNQQIAMAYDQAKNAHQWEVEDLKKAGLNPVLSANSGASLANTSMQMPDYSSLNGMGSRINEIMNSAQQIANNTKLTNAQVDNLDTQSAKNIAETKTIPEYLKNDTSKKTAEIQNINLQNEFLEKSMGARINAEFGKAEQEIAKGDISADSAQFLAKYGITREEALQLGTVGIQELNKLVMKGADLFTISRKAKEFLKVGKRLKNSAKKI